MVSARSAPTGETHADLVEGEPRIVPLAHALDTALGPAGEEQERPEPRGSMALQGVPQGSLPRRLDVWSANSASSASPRSERRASAF